MDLQLSGVYGVGSELWRQNRPAACFFLPCCRSKMDGVTCASSIPLWQTDAAGQQESLIQGTLDSPAGALICITARFFTRTMRRWVTQRLTRLAVAVTHVSTAYRLMLYAGHEITSQYASVSLLPCDTVGPKLIR